jgi:metallophosphoesterase superfamily enzyme
VGDVGLMETPLFHAKVFPDLTQVYFLFATIFVLPALAHLLPGNAANDRCEDKLVIAKIDTRTKEALRISEIYL